MGEPGSKGEKVMDHFDDGYLLLVSANFNSKDDDYNLSRRFLRVILVLGCQAHLVLLGFLVDPASPPCRWVSCLKGFSLFHILLSLRPR